MKKDIISKAEYDAHGVYSSRTCTDRFETWNDALIAAGLLGVQPSDRVPQKRVKDENELLEEIRTIWARLGRQPTVRDIRNGESNYSDATFVKHFGSWKKALEAAASYKISDISDISEISHSHNEMQSDSIKNSENEETPTLEKYDNFQAFYEAQEKDAKIRPMSELENIVKQQISDRVASKVVRTTQFYRNPYVAEYIKRRAKGFCQLCGNPAPFNNADGTPYLESHHIIWLSQGGLDNIYNTVALCPNCHRKMHIVQDLNDIRILQTLIEKIESK